MSAGSPKGEAMLETRIYLLQNFVYGKRALWIFVGFLHISKGSGSLAFGGSSDPSKLKGKFWQYDLYSWSDQGITRRATLPNTTLAALS
jgi:hypothetical protein